MHRMHTKALRKNRAKKPEKTIDIDKIGFLIMYLKPQIFFHLTRKAFPCKICKHSLSHPRVCMQLSSSCLWVFFKVHLHGIFFLATQHSRHIASLNQIRTVPLSYRCHSLYHIILPWLAPDMYLYSLWPLMNL